MSSDVVVDLNLVCDYYQQHERKQRKNKKQHSVKHKHTTNNSGGVEIEKKAKKDAVHNGVSSCSTNITQCYLNSYFVWHRELTFNGQITCTLLLSVVCREVFLDTIRLQQLLTKRVLPALRTKVLPSVMVDDPYSSSHTKKHNTYISFCFDISGISSSSFALTHFMCSRIKVNLIVFSHVTVWKMVSKNHSKNKLWPMYVHSAKGSAVSVFSSFFSFQVAWLLLDYRVCFQYLRICLHLLEWITWKEELVSQSQAGPDYKECWMRRKCHRTIFLNAWTEKQRVILFIVHYTLLLFGKYKVVFVDFVLCVIK